MRIENKVVLITGAGQGIGRGIALRLAADGADIAIVDLNEAKMAEVAGEVRRIPAAGRIGDTGDVGRTPNGSFITLILIEAQQPWKGTPAPGALPARPG